MANNGFPHLPFSAKHEVQRVYHSEMCVNVTNPTIEEREGGEEGGKNAFGKATTYDEKTVRDLQGEMGQWR